MYISHCIVRNDNGEWCVGEIMTYPLNGYKKWLKETRRQSHASISSPTASNIIRTFFNVSF